MCQNEPNQLQDPGTQIRLQMIIQIAPILNLTNTRNTVIKIVTIASIVTHILPTVENTFEHTSHDLLYPSDNLQTHQILTMCDILKRDLIPSRLEQLHLVA